MEGMWYEEDDVTILNLRRDNYSQDYELEKVSLVNQENRFSA